MKNKRNLIILIVCVAVALVVVGGVFAQTAGGYDLSWWTIDGGGGQLTGGGYTLSGTVGQADAGAPMTGGGYTLNGGFWGGGQLTGSGSEIYLPLISK